MIVKFRWIYNGKCYISWFLHLDRIFAHLFYVYLCAICPSQSVTLTKRFRFQEDYEVHEIDVYPYTRDSCRFHLFECNKKTLSGPSRLQSAGARCIHIHIWGPDLESIFWWIVMRPVVDHTFLARVIMRLITFFCYPIQGYLYDIHLMLVSNIAFYALQTILIWRLSTFALGTWKSVGYWSLIEVLPRSLFGLYQKLDYIMRHWCFTPYYVANYVFFIIRVNKRELIWFSRKR